MKYNNEARSNKSNENKKRIIDCAIRLINEKGFDNVTVSEITQVAGVSKGAFYIHFKSKEDIIEQQISLFNEFKLDESKPRFERLEYFLCESIKCIKESSLKMAQEWFSQSVKGSFFGKSKLTYDRKAVTGIIGDERLADEIVSVYYGVLNLWCFADGEIDPESILKEYLEKNLKERLQ